MFHVYTHRLPGADAIGVSVVEAPSMPGTSSSSVNRQQATEKRRAQGKSLKYWTVPMSTNFISKHFAQPREQAFLRVKFQDVIA